jgi:hypothetical protein
MDKKKKVKFMKLRHKLAVFKQKTKESQEIKAILNMSAEILMLGFLGGMSLLVLLDVSLIIKFLGIGCFLWLFKEKLYPLICGILSSIALVHTYK